MQETDFLWQPMKVIGNGCFGKVGPRLCTRMLSHCIGCLILFGAKNHMRSLSAGAIILHTPVT
jgi:hypothetical protein